MAAVLHLLRRRDPALALAVIARQVRAGDSVTLALLDNATVPADLPIGVRIRRVPSELSHEQLLELIFAADNVVTW